MESDIKPLENRSFYYTRLDRLYYEPLDHYTKQGLRDLLGSLVPPDWTIHHRGIWLHARKPGERHPPQGFKIHVSSTERNVEETLARVARVGVAFSVSFKVAADVEIVRIINSKRYDRGSSAKVMTIYPADVDQFRVCIAAVAEAAEGLDGPFVLSDRRFRESKVVYYRYGGFAQRSLTKPNGEVVPAIEAPNGELVPDLRNPFYVLPDWLEEPFEDEDDDLTAAADDEPVVLNGRFRVDDVLAASNAGGVYLAVDTSTGISVVVKEARPYTHCLVGEDEQLDAVDLLKRERDFLEIMAPSGVVPAPLAFFEDWEHSFLVMERVEGVSLAQLRASREYILLPYLGNDERECTFRKLFSAVMGELAYCVEAAHSFGVAICDISPANVIVDPFTLKCRLIDLEGAFFVDEPQSIQQAFRRWRTPGFGTSEEDALSGDWHALSMVLFSLILPITPLFGRNPAAEETVWRRLEMAGLPADYRCAISRIRDGHWQEAMDIFRNS